MPFSSEKQRKFLWSQHPDIARRWEGETKVNSRKKALKKAMGRKSDTSKK